MKLYLSPGEFVSFLDFHRCFQSVWNFRIFARCCVGWTIKVGPNALLWVSDICSCSVTKSCLILCDPMDYSTPGFPVLHSLQELAKLMSTESMMPSNHLILCHPLLLLPSIFPSIKVFSSELSLCIRWPKYWSFRFSISPSNEYSGLISFRINWLGLLAVQGAFKSFF